MATYSNTNPNDGTVQIVSIVGLANGETSGVIEWAEYQDRSIQVSGVFGVGGNLAAEGSNDGITWSPLSNAAGGTVLAFTTSALRQVLEGSRYMRLRVTAGDGTTLLKASVFLRRASSIRT